MSRDARTPSLEEHVVSGNEFEITVRDVTASTLAVPPDTLRQDASLSADLRVDDVVAAQLLQAIEGALEARFPDDFWDGIDTYGQFSSAVRLSLTA